MTTAPDITPAVWQRMPWHPKAKICAQLDLEHRMLSEFGAPAEARQALNELREQLANARLVLRVAEQTIADLAERLHASVAVEDARLGPARLAAAVAEVFPTAPGPKRRERAA